MQGCCQQCALLHAAAKPAPGFVHVRCDAHVTSDRAMLTSWAVGSDKKPVKPGGYGVRMGMEPGPGHISPWRATPRVQTRAPGGASTA